MKDCYSIHPDAKIGKNTKLSGFIYIEGDVTIGDNCKIKSFSYICDGITIEDNCFIGPNVSFTNDKNPRATNEDGSLKISSDWKLERTIVRKGASIGAGSVIIGPVTIGENAMVGAGSIVTKDVNKGFTMIGNPAKVLYGNR